MLLCESNPPIRHLKSERCIELECLDCSLHRLGILRLDKHAAALRLDDLTQLAVFRGGNDQRPVASEQIAELRGQYDVSKSALLWDEGDVRQGKELWEVFLLDQILKENVLES
jgi:hypothetical protein